MAHFDANRCHTPESLTAIVEQAPTDPAQLLVARLVQNTRRAVLKPFERARAFRRLMADTGWSTTRLSKELAISQPSISQALKLLELPDEVQRLVERGNLAPGTAYEISKLGQSQDQLDVAVRAVAERLRRSQVRSLVRARKANATIPAPPTPTLDP